MKIEDLPGNDDWGLYDWQQVFPGEWSSDYRGTYEAGFNCPKTDDVTPERIARVVNFWATWDDGSEMFAVVELTDGQWAMCEASTDYTGWGCQASALWKVGPTAESVIAELTEHNRRKLAHGEAEVSA